MAGQEFEATLIKDEESGGVGIRIPFDVQQAFGKKGQVKVRCTIDGMPYRGSIHPYGGVYYMGVIKKIREAIDKGPGDLVNVTMEVDDEPRVVEVPEDLAQALTGNEKARAAFEKLSYSHKREYVEWIAEGKKEETRARRIANTVEELSGSGAKKPR
ncbi:YdeI/OmpD-associated family protein [Methanocella sp. MCL-LM]|uniref:YdeI/OmpD-associated family protein n=1 Tax=Methanocella sp. MCL-LM TaxID=3412035 RepID=UPI003C7437D2